MMSKSAAGKYLVTLLCIAMIMASCSNRPDGVPSKDDMASVLTDLQKLEAYWSMTDGYGNVANDSVRKVLRQQMLQRHGMTQRQFEQSLKWYAHHIDDYVEVYDLVQKNLEAEERSLAQQDGMTSASLVTEVSDGDNLWNALPVYVLRQGYGRECLRFSIPKPGSLQPGDLLRWQMKTSSRQSLSRLVLGVDYADGTTTYTSKQFSPSEANGLYITLQTDSVQMVQRIYGVLQYGLNNGEMLMVDSIAVIRQPLAPETYHLINTQYTYKPNGNIKRVMQQYTDTLTNRQERPDPAAGKMFSHPSMLSR